MWSDTVVVYEIETTIESDESQCRSLVGLIFGVII